MGILVDDARFLAYARSLGVDFSTSLTIGRQNFYVDAADRAALLRRYAPRASGSDLESVLGATYVDSFLRILGAATIDAMDMSAYEGATLIHDMNLPMPDHFKCRYSAVVEAGSLEHVFDVRQSFTNLLDLPKAGGHVVMIAPANNHCGHGFYQFSPELLYRVFSAENGYAVRAMILREDFADAKWYRVNDPAAVRARVELVNSLPVLITVIAQRTEIKPVLRQAPQQSDYTTLWSASRPSQPEVANPRPGTPVKNALRELIGRIAPGTLLRLRGANYRRRLLRDRRLTFENTRFYTPFSP